MAFDTLADAIDNCIENGPRRIVRVKATGKFVTQKDYNSPVPDWCVVVVALYSYPMTTTDWNPTRA